MLPLLRGLTAAGYDVHCITSPGPVFEEIRNEPDWTAHAIEMPAGISPFADLVAVHRLRKHFRELRYTVVHAHMNKCALLAMQGAWLAGVPVRIYHNHGPVYFGKTGLRRRAFMAIDKLACRLATRVLYVSASNHRDSVEAGVCPQGRGAVLADGSIVGLDASRFWPERVRPFGPAVRREFGIPSDSFVVGFIGRAVSHKGFYESLNTWTKHFSDDPKFHLLMLGVTKDDVAGVLGTLPKNLSVVGFTKEIERFYGAMNVVILPSEREGLGYSLLEGAAAELPTIGSNISGIEDALADGETGYLVPFRDDDALAAAIRKLAGDPELCLRLGKAGRERVERVFSQRVVIDALVAEYDRLLTERGIALPDR